MSEWISKLSGALSWLAVLIVVAMACSITADAFYRLITGRPIAGVIEYNEVGLVALVFLSLAGAQRRQEHVSTDIVVRLLSARSRRYVVAVGLVAALVVLAVLTMTTAQLAWASYTDGEYRFGLIQVPIWPAKVAMALGLLVLLLAVLDDFVGVVRRGVDGPTGQEQESADPVGP